RARIAGFLAFDREALADAKASIARMRQKQVERIADARTRAAQLAAITRLRAAERRTLEDELEKAKGFRAELRRKDKDTMVLVVSTHRLFHDGQAFLSYSGRLRLTAIADALLSGPPTQIQISVFDDEMGEVVSAARLARRRADRIREVLLERGIPEEW